MALLGKRRETLTNESQLRFWYTCIYIYIYVWQSSKRSMCVHPRRLLKNVSISTGAKNSGQKDFEVKLGKEKKMAKSYGHSMGETFQLSFPKLAKCIYFLVAVVS